MPNRGATAVRHFRALLDADPQVRAVQWAGKRVVWIPKVDLGIGAFNPNRSGKIMTPISRGEDLFGCFDALVLREGTVPELVQITTYGPSAPYQRMRKIEQTFLSLFTSPPLLDVFVFAWERRRHFRRWRWSTTKRDWVSLPPIPSPACKRVVSRVSGRSRSHWHASHAL